MTGQKREAVVLALSQRLACRLTGLSLSTCRYDAQLPADDAHLSGRITELALERRCLTAASGSCRVGMAFTSIANGYTVFTTLMD